MKSQHLPISYEEFQRMPKRLGWKYEYYGDCAHITPGHAIVVTAVEITPCVVNTPCTIRPVVEADLPQLRPAYFAAFEETTDYCDWAPKRIKEAAEQNLSSFFAGKRGEPLSASQIATAEQNDGREEVIGTILIVEKEDGPLVDLLFVVPDWHRKGVATALASTALNVLHTSGNEKLRSRFLLGNAESRQWHHRFGFVDEPDLWVARAHTHTHYYHCHDELERHEAIGHLTATEHKSLQEELTFWQEMIKKLDEIANIHGFAAAHPAMRYD